MQAHKPLITVIFCSFRLLLILIILSGLSSLRQAGAQEPLPAPGQAKPQAQSLPDRQSTGLADSSGEEVLTALSNDIADLLDRHCFAEAAVLARRGLDSTRERKGEDHPDNIEWLNNLAWILQAQGNYGEARPLFEQSLAIADKSLGQANQTTATCLSNLASLLSLQGDYENAGKLYARALAVSEKAVGPEGLPVAKILSNLAGLLAMQGRSESAMAMYQRAIGIMEQHRDSSEIDLFDILNNAALELESRGEITQALAYLKRALELKEQAIGADGLDLADTLNNIAVLEGKQGNLQTALALQEKALRIYEQGEGPEHIDLANALNNLGDIYFRSGNEAAARDSYLKAAAITNSYIEHILPALSFAEQQAAISGRVPMAVSRLLSACRDEKTLPQAYSLIYGWKGLAVKSLARQCAAARLADSPSLCLPLAKLKTVRSRLASWYQEAGTMPYSLWKRTNDALTSEKESTERSVSGQLQALGLDSGETPSNFSAFRKSLKSNECLVDIYLYHAIDRQLQGSWRYAAIIVGPVGTEKEACFVDLGVAAKIDNQLAAWRQDILSGQDSRQSGQSLFESLSPALSSLPSEARRIFVSPDGELSRLPWQLFVSENQPSGDALVCQVDSADELFCLRSRSVRQTTLAGVPQVLVAGGIDFNASTSAQPVSQPGKSNPLFSLSLLPGSLSEANDVAAIAEKEHFKVVLFTGATATKEAIIKALPGATYAHLSTHGFFLDESTMAAIRSQALRSAARNVIPHKRAADGFPGWQRNPLVESGIALSGANSGNGQSGEKPGYLTAEELVGLNLLNCKLLTLSACDTGRGKEITGQGVLGLRSSIMAAGAGSILMSLWKVPDAQTSKLMHYFYEGLWLQKLCPAEALRQSQARLKKELAGEQTAAWAAWILVGDCW